MTVLCFLIHLSTLTSFNAADATLSPTFYQCTSCFPLSLHDVYTVSTQKKIGGVGGTSSFIWGCFLGLDWDRAEARGIANFNMFGVLCFRWVSVVYMPYAFCFYCVML